MPLMTRARRPLAIALLAALAAPALIMPFAPRSAVSMAENRRLATAPAWPRGPADLRRFTRGIDAYMADNFGLRELLIRLGARVRKQLGAANRLEAAPGLDGWLFLREGLLQSTGLVTNSSADADYGRFVCDLDQRLRARRSKLLFAMVPSPGEIYPEVTPDWARPARRPTDYDIMLAAASACGAQALDLRTPLIQAKPTGQLYQRLDTHWTPRAVLVAFNAMAAALGRLEWRTSANQLRWTVIERGDGGLPRMAGQAARAERLEIHERGSLPRTARKTPIPGVKGQSRQPFVVETGHAGPTVLILGDSFTEVPLPPMFEPFTGRVAWAHHDLCDFDWAVIDRVNPDYVVLAPAEREASCEGRRPRGMPKS
jgi:hypothetical protein